MSSEQGFQCVDLRHIDYQAQYDDIAHEKHMSNRGQAERVTNDRPRAPT